MCVALFCPIYAKSRNGDQLIVQGQAAEVRKEYDKALDLYERALSEDPADAGYQIAVNRVRFQAGQAHLERGLKFRKDGKRSEALAEFEKAYAIDPSSSIAEQEIRAQATHAQILVLNEINSLRPNPLTFLELDYKLWMLGRGVAAPHHLTRTTAY